MQSSIWRVTVASLAFFQISHVTGFGIHVVDSFNSLHMVAAPLTVNPTHIDLLGAYKQILATHPLPTKMITGATLAVCGDAIAQSKDASTEYDTRRASSFAIFDMVYRALQHFAFPVIVATCHGQYLGQWDVMNLFDTSQWAAMEQTLASQLGIVPFLYYPAFFALTGFVQGLSANSALTRAKENFFPLMQRNLVFWIPVQFIQFGYIQDELQIPFLSCCGLAWTFILSVAAGSTRNYTPQKEVEEVQFRAAEHLVADEMVDLSSDDTKILLSGLPANATSF